MGQRQNKSAYPLDGNCQQNDVIYKRNASTSANQYKVYLRTRKEEHKKGYYNHNKSFRKRSDANETNLL